MAEIIKFPSNTSQFNSLLNNMSNKFKNLPPDLKKCIKESFAEIYNLSPLAREHYEVAFPEDLTPGQKAALQAEIRALTDRFDKDIYKILAELAKEKANLCLLENGLTDLI